MVELDFLAAWFGARYLAISRRVRAEGSDRGDVPGWVMVTVMTAGLVVAIFAVFKGQISDALKGAIDNVTNTTGG